MIRIPAADLLQEIPIARNGEPLFARVYPTARPGGRRIIVTEAFGGPLYDTADCYDLGNAVSSVIAWLKKQSVSSAIVA